MRVSSATFQTEMRIFAMVDRLETSPIPHLLWPLLSACWRKRKEAFLLNSICHGLSLYLGFFLNLRNLALCSNSLQGLGFAQFSSEDTSHFFQIERKVCWRVGGSLLLISGRGMSDRRSAGLSLLKLMMLLWFTPGHDFAEPVSSVGILSASPWTLELLFKKKKNPTQPNTFFLCLLTFAPSYFCRPSHL